MRLLLLSISFLFSTALTKADPCVPDLLKQILKNDSVSEESITRIAASSKNIKLVQVSNANITAKQLQQIKKGENFQYIISEDDMIHLIPENDIVVYDKNSDILLNVSKNSTGDQSPHFIKEAGVLRFDQETGKFVKDADYNFDLSPEEKVYIDDKVKNQIANIDHGNSIKFENSGGLYESKLFECAAILEGKKVGKNFILDMLMAANLVNVGSILVVDRTSVLQSDVYKKGMADMAAINFNTVVYGNLNKVMLLKNIGVSKSIAARSGLMIGLNQIRKPLFEDPIQGEKSRAEKSDPDLKFNNVWSLATAPIDYWVDNQFIENIPNYLYEQCRMGKKVSVFMSPHMLRIYAEFGNAVAYFALRKALVGSPDEKK